MTISLLESPLTRKASAAVLAAAGLGGSLGAFATTPAYAEESAASCETFYAGAGARTGYLQSKIGDGYTATTVLDGPYVPSSCNTFLAGWGRLARVNVVKYGVGGCASSLFEDNSATLDWSNGCGSGYYSNWGQGFMVNPVGPDSSNTHTVTTPYKQY